MLVPKNVQWEVFDKIDLWRYELVLNYMAVATEYAKHENHQNTFDSYRINASAQLWRTLVGGDYGKILKRLRELGIICISKKWSGGRFPKQYWLGEGHRDYETREETFKVKYQRGSFQERWFKRQIKVVAEQSGIPAWVYEYLQSVIDTRVTISATEEELRECGRLVKPAIDENGCEYKQKQVRPYDLTILENLKKHTDVMGKPGTHSYRFFSPITQLCSVPRGFLRGDSGEVLTEIDIQCSQPTFLMLSAIAEYGDTAPFSKWITQIKEGDLYDYFAKGIGVADRDTLKSDYLFSTLYGPVFDTDVLWSFIKRDCPKFAEFIFRKKNGYSREKADYARLAISAQQTESKFILGKIVKRMIETFPESFALTVHDSIITTGEYSEWLLQTMKDEFAKLGVSPRLKRKELLFADTKRGWKDYRSLNTQAWTSNTHLSSN